ncbi:zinc finger MYM-type protein 1-like [Metopolophium dirhodum]|uniref:zinc finger MYM-type protein 1-like n=1 Tax=Metopolophium dirhodum TaxID=44670 RepID=UPI0029901D0B|nr:zinc finger MYM-type protein 1-like [Metopolophium dirhodum]
MPQENLLDISTNCGIEEKLIEEVNGSAESQSDITPHDNLMDISTNCGIEEKLTEDKNFNRHLTLAMFTRSLPNGQKCNRKWLLYSPSEGSVYCFVCKLYGSNRESPFISGGFDKWKKSERIVEHENSLQHRNATNKWLLRSNTNNSVNKELCRQISAETNYWFEVLKRLVSVITFLSSRGLAFRGKEEKFNSQHNGNYLGLLELISEYDPFLKAHIEQYGNQGKGNPSYLSKTVYHQGQSMYKVLDDFLEKSELDIMNIRGQSYDNASNMSGQFKGLQAYVKNKNPLAVFIPCTAHSLNLVGVNSVNCCTEAVNFFDFVQKLYNFFSGSTHRWNVLINILKKEEKNSVNGNSSRLLTLKSLSDTRWSCHAEACKAIVVNYEQILTALKSMYDGKENNVTTLDAKSLWKKMVKRETAYMSLLWNDIMERSNITSTKLQHSNCDTMKAINLLKSLKCYVLSLRDSNSIYEEKIPNLSPEIIIYYSDEKQRKKIKKFPDGSINEEVLKGKNKFRVQTHIFIIDKFVSELNKRISAYEYIGDNFLFITHLTQESNEKIDLSVSTFISKYKNDVDITLPNELVQFKEYWKLYQPSFDPADISKLFSWFGNQSLEEVFPCLFTTLKIYLTIPVANCSVERAFSKLTRIKNKYRTSQTQENLNIQMILYSENDLLKSLDLNDVLKELASSKARKKNLIN